MKKTILDPASGGRMFYFDKNDPRVMFGDIREHEEHESSNGRRITVKPDMVMDFRSLPFDDETYNTVIFDPPHLTGLGETSWYRKAYGVLDKETWRDDLAKGFSECFRVLKPNGVLIFKWNEFNILTSEVIKLAGCRPIIGHQSGTKMKTHWLLFIKEMA